MRRLALLAVVLLAGACGGHDHGGSSSAGGATRTVKVAMADIAFRPESLTVKKGETVKFVFTNTGKVDHDAFIGDEAAQRDHEKEMANAGDMHHHGGNSDAVTVEPGKTASLTHTFDDAGDTIIGCHQRGHYAAGMKVTVTAA